MTVAVVSKKKTGSVCGECAHTLSDDEIQKKECAECGSDEIKKSLTIVRKAVGDDDDDLETAVVEDSTDEDEEDDGEDEEEDEVVDEEDSEDDDDEEEDDDEEDDVESEKKELAAVGKSLRDVEVMNIMTACAEDVSKALDEGDETAYEEVMVELNNVLDSAVKKWAKGKTITKATDADGHKSVIRDRVNGVIGKEKVVAKKKATKKVESITKREDLPEDVQKSLKAADDIVEKEAVRHWDEIAKSLPHLGLDGPTLRKLGENDPKTFETLKKSLDTANEQLETSDIFKSYGQPGGDEKQDESGVDMKEAREIAKSEKITLEQAKVRLMDGKSYQATA